MRLQLHTPRMHNANASPHADVHKHKASVFSRLSKAEGGFDYLVVALIVVLGGAMLVGLLTASG